MSRASKKRLGANGVWPRVPTFDVPVPPPGYPSGDHVTLDEADERILDEVWTEIRRRPARVFDQTLPPVAGTTPQAGAPAAGAGHKARVEPKRDGAPGNARRKTEPRPANRAG